VLIAIVIRALWIKAVLMLLSKRQVGYAVARIATDLRLRLLRALLAARWSYASRQPAGAPPTRWRPRPSAPRTRSSTSR
jgi:ATP-binding cassette subfamily C protein